MPTLGIRNLSQEDQESKQLIKDTILKLVQATGENGLPVAKMIDAVQKSFSGECRPSESFIRAQMHSLLANFELDLHFDWRLVDPNKMDEILSAPYDEVKDKYNYVAWS